MSQKKSTTPKNDREAAARIRVTEKDTLLLLKRVHEAGVSSNAAVDILGWIDDLTDNAPSKQDYVSDENQFTRYILEGWQKSGPNLRANVGDIIQRLRAGQTIDEIHQHFEQMRAEIRAKNEERERNRKEPKDWTSPEWCYWKLNRLEGALTAGGKQYRAAYSEVSALVRELCSTEDFFNMILIRPMLAHLIIARQEIARLVGQTPDMKRKPAYFKKGGGR